MLLYEVVRSN